MPSGMGFSPSGCWFSTRMERRVKVNTMTSTLTFVNITSRLGGSRYFGRKRSRYGPGGFAV